MPANGSPSDSVRLWAELVLLYLGGPALMALDVLPGHKLIWLAGATACCLIWYVRCGECRISELAGFRRRPGLRAMGLRVLVAGLAILALVLALSPETLLGFPRQRPVLWLVVLALYPPLSAYPQELLYRGFFFRRYGALFPSERALVLASAFAFAWLHIIYGNVPALVLSLIGGLVFAEIYRRSGSLFWTSVEHAAYGLLVFSLGLGRFFYGGPN